MSLVFDVLVWKFLVSITFLVVPYTLFEYSFTKSFIYSTNLFTTSIFSDSFIRLNYSSVVPDDLCFLSVLTPCLSVSIFYIFVDSPCLLFHSVRLYNGPDSKYLTIIFATSFPS